jgi:hypothetical protein
MSPGELKVCISEEARTAVFAIGARDGYVKPGLVVHRIGPIGDVKRNASGQAEWAIERPRPLRVEVQDLADRFADPTFAVVVDGVLVVFMLFPRPGESGVNISLSNGELYAEPTDA